MWPRGPFPYLLNQFKGSPTEEDAHTMATSSSTLSHLIIFFLVGNKDKNHLCFHKIIILSFHVCAFQLAAVATSCSPPPPPKKTLHQKRALTNRVGKVNETPSTFIPKSLSPCVLRSLFPDIFSEIEASILFLMRTECSSDTPAQPGLSDAGRCSRRGPLVTDGVDT